MEKYNVSLIGINLVENENVFIGAIIRINSIRNIVLIAKQSEEFTPAVNTIIESLNAKLQVAKDVNEYAKLLQKPGTKFMIYSVSMILDKESATADEVSDATKKRFFKVLTNLNSFEIMNNAVRELDPALAV